MQQDQDLKSIDDMLAAIGGANDAGKQSVGPCGLLLEHLRGARSNLLGSRFQEYRASLTDAKESLACIVDKGSRSNTSKTLQGLLAATRSATTTGSA
jgi:hypothetical protein